MNIQGIDFDEFDDRQNLVEKMENVNRKLIEKLKHLEEVIAETIDRAYSHTKKDYGSHRDWDEGDELKERAKKIK